MIAINPSGLWKKRLGDWVINPYVGCEHGCYHCYCPAMPGVKFNNQKRKQQEWGTYLLPKHEIVAALARQLKQFSPEKARTSGWGDGWILMSFLTDCYTPAEASLGLTRRCLQLLLEAGHRVRVQTRSVLVERDFDLLLAHRAQVCLGTSLPYLDDELSKILEPRAALPSERLALLRKAREAGLDVYVAVAPFMPFHGPETMLEVLKAISPLEPHEIFCEVLNPKGENREMMGLALSEARPVAAEQIRHYDTPTWAAFTHKTLSFGLGQHPNFIPWPDTMRGWKPYLAPAEAAFLEKFLPAVDRPPTEPGRRHARL